MSNQNNFKEGLKGTALFGGVGVLNIIISIIRSKVIATLLGPAGMGLLGIFNSAIDLINKSTNFSLRTSAVKDISNAYVSNDEQKLTNCYSVFRKLILLTGLLGLIVCLALSPYLSLSSFGNYSNTIPFVVLALTFPLLQQLDGLNVMMQGTKHLKLLAKANVYGNIFSLLAVIPLYYLFGITGIAYTIVLGYFVHYFITWLFSRRIKVTKIPISIKMSLKEGKSMLNMGLIISLQGVFVALSAYIVRAYINQVNSVEEVGLYTAGFYIINTYTGLIFSSMSTEYYPRIASMSEDNKAMFKAVDSQSLLSIILLAPLLCVFILLGNIAIKLLYSDDFLPVTVMINISMLGVFFKAPSWCLGYVFLGKGDSKAFFWNELVVIIYTLTLNIVFYSLWGLTGMGISFLLSFFLYWIQNVLLCHFRYGYSFELTFLNTMIPQLIIASLCFICSFIDNMIIRYSIGSILCLTSFSLSYRVLNDNIDMRTITARFRKR